MGMGSEWMAEHAFEMDFPFGFAGNTWKTQDGRKILLTDMTEQHIRNCMKLTGRVCGGWYEAFADELKRRGK